MATTARKAPFGRVLTAIATPFDGAGGLDVGAAQALATFLAERGHDGLVVSGTTGESPTTTDAEKETLLRAVVEAVGDRMTVVAGVGTNDTHHTVELARSAEKAGAHALLVVTPYYNKPPQAGLVRHFSAVADATDLPVMLYDIPGRTGVPIESATLAALASHERIVAVKDAKADLYAGARVIAETRLAYYSGDDALNLPWLAVGAVGIVSVVAHLAGREYAELVAATAAGDLERARQLNARLLPLVAAVMTPRSQGAAMAKAVLHAWGVLPSAAVRSPLVEPERELVDAALAAAEAAGVAR